MSTKVTVSCESMAELESVLGRIRDMADKVLIPEPKGKYIRAYVHIGYQRKRKPAIDRKDQRRYNSYDDTAIADVEKEYPIP